VAAVAIRVHLEDILKKRGMTSKELCKLVGITEANLSVLRSGKAKGVRFHTINRICYYLQCDVGDILKFDGNLEEDEDDE
jgi:putative transcriptional regulator